MAATDRAERAARDAAANPWVQRLARAGYAAKGLVYVLIGVLAAQVAFGTGGQTTGTQGALRQVAEMPFGSVLLVALAIGLAGYALWRLLEAGIDPEGEAHGAKGVARRIGYAISGIIYGALAWSAIRLLGAGSGGGGGAKGWTARLMAQPFGPWLVGVVGAVLVGVGIYYVAKAYKTTFRKRLPPGRMDARARDKLVKLGRFGIAARAFVFVLSGVFLIVAALQADPSEAKGLGEVLSTLAAQPYGTLLLAVVALGLAAYGLYQFALARYRRFETA